MEPSEISSGCFLAILERRKDPSETISVEDILARAAAKGLLDGMVEEKGKEEKKKKRVTQRRCNITGSGREPKTAEVLHHQTVSNIKAEVTTSKAVSNIQKKNVTQTNGCAQLKKSVKPASGTALPKAVKPPVGKTNLRQRRTECKRIVLKPAQIFFPPPFLDLLGNQSRTPSSQHHFHGWTGAKGSSGRIPPPPSKAGKPSVLSHPRRWL